MPSHSRTGNIARSSPRPLRRRSLRGAGGSRLPWLALRLPADGASPAGPGPVSERLPPKASIPLRRHPKRRAGQIRSINGWSRRRISTAALPLTTNSINGQRSVSGQTCFETFPHAVACALAGKILSAKQKRADRSRLLREAEVSTEAITNMDWIDAALCALAAHHLVMGTFKTYGDVAEGLIVVPQS